VVLAEGDEIGTAEFPQIAALMTRPMIAPAPARADATPQEPSPNAAPMILDEAPAMSPHAPHDHAPHGPAPADALALIDAAGNVRPLEEIETEVIRFAIARYRGQMSEVARRLRIGRSTLYRKLDDIGLGGEDSGETEAENVAAE
jgi:DNA-binding NtrC family response regulator